MKAFRSISISATNISLSLVLFALMTVASAGQEAPETRRRSYRREVVRRVVIDGVKTFRKSDIQKILFTKPNHWYNFLKKRRLSRTNVQYDVTSIERFYRKRGFLTVDVSYSIDFDEKDRAIVTFTVDEGKRTILSGVHIIGGIDEINRKFDKTLSQFKVGDPVNAGLVLSARFTLRDLYYDNSHPYASVSSGYDFNFDGTSVYVRYEVAESLYTVYGKTSMAKSGMTDNKVITREITCRPGGPYRSSDIVESERRLLSTGLFKYLNLRKNDSTAVVKDDTCTVGLRLNYEERKPFFLNGAAGVGREEDFDMVFRLSVQWGNRNLWGTGRRMFLNFQPSFQLLDSRGPLKNLNLTDLGRKLRFNDIRKTIELNYVEPWPLGFRVPAALKLTYEPNTLNIRIRDFSYRYDRVAGEVILLYELDKFTTARLSGATEYINIKNVPQDQQEAFRAEGDNQIRRTFSVYGERDTRDNIFVPQRGSYSFASIDYVGQLLGGDFNFFKAQISWSRYQILTAENVMATRIWLGWLDDMGKKGRSSAEDRFMLGGATTIRGYAENSLGPVFVAADNPGDKLGKPKGGRYMMLGNVELRRSLFWRFGGSAFVDAGNTYSEIGQITPLSIAFTAGLGMQFFTPVGPIRFDYGVRLKKDFDLGAGNYHLAILYAF